MRVIDFKFNNKAAVTVTVNADNITVHIEEPDVVNNTCKTPTETEQNNTGTANEISQIDWKKVKEFVEENDIELNDVESGVLDSYITKGTVSPKQERVLPHVLRKVQEHGFKPSYLF